MTIILNQASAGSTSAWFLLILPNLWYVYICVHVHVCMCVCACVRGCVCLPVKLIYFIVSVFIKSMRWEVTFFIFIISFDPAQVATETIIRSFS